MSKRRISKAPAVTNPADLKWSDIGTEIHLCEPWACKGVLEAIYPDSLGGWCVRVVDVSDGRTACDHYLGAVDMEPRKDQP